jgi:hypothetical protein
MQLAIDGLEVRSAQTSDEQSQTTVQTVGGCVVAITTALPNRGVVLNTAYLADLSTQPLAASYLFSAAGHKPHMWQQMIGEELIATSLIRACLLDHAAALRACLEDVWKDPVCVSVSDDALEQIAEVWRSASRPQR